MVASISARGGAKAALAYYTHLRGDDYYLRGGEPPGRWAGAAADRLSLHGPVTRTEFEAALLGNDPKTGQPLVQHGGRAREHSAGWDMTFSAPKSVSVLWALSADQDRHAIELAQWAAVQAATAHLEYNAAWARRGKGGALREQTAGLLMAQFDHHTSRELDPQLHTHGFIFNLAPRRDGTWGAIVSRDLYQAQKEAGAVYRQALAGELERLGYRLDRQANNFRVAAIPHGVERAFSKRRQAIEEAARAHGYTTPKGMEQATLRTRRAKREGQLDGLFKTWQAEAKAMGFELGKARREVANFPLPRPATISPASRSMPASAAPANVPAVVANQVQAVAQLASQLGRGLGSLDQSPAGMPGISIRLRQRDREPERE